MDIKYWTDRWENGSTAFHRDEYQPGLVKCFPVDPPGRVFVPLCGKTRDMIWLADHGWDVIGVEASPVACRDFFAENKIACHEEHRGAFTVFRGGRIEIWCGDFFALPAEAVDGITAIYDRAALVALPENMRPDYAAHLRRLAGGNKVRMLLIAIDYAQDKASGPPFSVDLAEVKRLYGDSFAITELKRHEDTVMPKLNPKFAGVRPYETVYMLEPM